MNLDMVQPKSSAEDLLLSITKNCETLLKQTRREAEETLDFGITKPKETFSFEPPLSIEGSWMIGLICLEFYNPKLNIIYQNYKFERYTDTFDEFLFEELKDGPEKIVNISNISLEHLPVEKIGPLIISAYEKLETGKRRTDGYYMLLGCARSPLSDFKSFLRMIYYLAFTQSKIFRKLFTP